MDEVRYGIDAVVAVTGVSPPSIKQWEAKGYLRSKLEPSGRGKVRGYSRMNIRELAVIRHAVTAGLPHKWLKAIQLPRSGWLLNWGFTIYAWHPSIDEVTKLHTESLAFDDLFGRGPSVVLLDIGQIIREVDAALEQHEPLPPRS